jgi:hypothetical protein
MLPIRIPPPHTTIASATFLDLLFMSRYYNYLPWQNVFKNSKETQMPKSDRNI